MSWRFESGVGFKKVARFWRALYMLQVSTAKFTMVDHAGPDGCSSSKGRCHKHAAKLKRFIDLQNDRWRKHSIVATWLRLTLGMDNEMSNLFWSEIKTTMFSSSGQTSVTSALCCNVSLTFWTRDKKNPVCHSDKLYNSFFCSRIASMLSRLKIQIRNFAESLNNEWNKDGSLTPNPNPDPNS